MPSRYNKPCPGHEHFCWGHRNLMREDDLVCTKCYRRLPRENQLKLFKIRDGVENISTLSIIVDWLLENPIEDEVNCNG